MPGVTARVVGGLQQAGGDTAIGEEADKLSRPWPTLRGNQATQEATPWPVRKLADHGA